MLKKLSDLITSKAGMMIASLALLIGVSSVNSICYIWYHQPKVPAGMERFNKQK